MEHLDITIDLESLSLSTNAAILQIAAVAWNREADTNPYIDTPPFVGFVDIRSCVFDKFDFEPRTIRWWGDQNDDVKKAVLTPAAHPLKEVLENLDRWIAEIKTEMKANTVCLWAQGSDFDIANLRNAFARYEMPFPIHHNYFRDARTFILEIGAYTTRYFDPAECIAHVDVIYKNIQQSMEDCPDDKHTALYDARQTTWNVWQMFKRLGLGSETK